MSVFTLHHAYQERGATEGNTPTMCLMEHALSNKKSYTNLSDRHLAQFPCALPSSLSIVNGPLVEKIVGIGKQTLYPVATLLETEDRVIVLCHAPCTENSLMIMVHYLCSAGLGGAQCQFGSVTNSDSKKNNVCRCLVRLKECGKLQTTDEPPFSGGDYWMWHGVAKFLCGQIPSWISPSLHSFSPASVLGRSASTAIFEFFPGVALTKVVYFLPDCASQAAWTPLDVEGDAPLSPSVLCCLLSGVLEGLCSLHSCGLVHGSLTPDAVLVSPNLEVTLYTAGYVVGANTLHSRRWCAPEVPLIHHRVDASLAESQAGDVWAFGCLAYSLATRRLPFHNENDLAAVVSALKQLYFESMQSDSGTPVELVRPRTRNPMALFGELFTVDDVDLLDIVKRCIDPNWTRRPTVSDIRQHPYFVRRSDASPHLGQVASLDHSKMGGSEMTISSVRREISDSDARASLSHEVDEATLSRRVKHMLISSVAHSFMRQLGGRVAKSDGSRFHEAQFDASAVDEEGMGDEDEGLLQRRGSTSEGPKVNIDVDAVMWDECLGAACEASWAVACLWRDIVSGDTNCERSIAAVSSLISDDECLTRVAAALSRRWSDAGGLHALNSGRRDTGPVVESVFHARPYHTTTRLSLSAAGGSALPLFMTGVDSTQKGNDEGREGINTNEELSFTAPHLVGKAGFSSVDVQRMTGQEAVLQAMESHPLTFAPSFQHRRSTVSAGSIAARRRQEAAQLATLHSTSPHTTEEPFPTVLFASRSAPLEPPATLKLIAATLCFSVVAVSLITALIFTLYST
ncbi:hypothetical protein TRVL_07011 [Trypanosoma vivax]|nr:hypothetical protein TRVL_07011 [Trypanosoma vivax]